MSIDAPLPPLDRLQSVIDAVDRLVATDAADRLVLRTTASRLLELRFALAMETQTAERGGDGPH